MKPKDLYLLTAAASRAAESYSVQAGERASALDVACSLLDPCFITTNSPRLLCPLFPIFWERFLFLFRLVLVLVWFLFCSHAITWTDGNDHRRSGGHIPILFLRFPFFALASFHLCLAGATEPVPGGTVWKGIKEMECAGHSIPRRVLGFEVDRSV
jgi:hypothetical protein